MYVYVGSIGAAVMVLSGIAWWGARRHCSSKRRGAVDFNDIDDDDTIPLVLLPAAAPVATPGTPPATS